MPSQIRHPSSICQPDSSFKADCRMQTTSSKTFLYAIQGLIDFINHVSEYRFYVIFHLSHTNQRYLWTDTFLNYYDLIILFGNGIVVENNSVELDEDTDARTYRGGESTSAKIEDYVTEKDDYTSLFLYTIWSMLTQNSLKEGKLE
ncbi:hypothetical protein D8674_004022 [Pyrus ussuriensis x Pyrus communis]|uniref:Uncharacterized protein n=1 Tax=Pyrus ussuriensis x Pyrus communis TaxID=2448454 RepID=A0A5N5FJA3_9ROSA|nr:hypothetical protein D8674_004022 [Pyrus ussuriensis x Pyrus communis]